MTPQDPVDFGALMTRLASGIEVMIEVEDEDEDGKYFFTYCKVCEAIE